MIVLAICGSIREKSSNHAILEAIRRFFPTSTDWETFPIKELPYFDPKLQYGSDVPAKVLTMREIAGRSDYIVISTPEYAHGIPGILKNALEWLLCEETMKKKVIVIIGTASGGEF